MTSTHKFSLQEHAHLIQPDGESEQDSTTTPEKVASEPVAATKEVVDEAATDAVSTERALPKLSPGANVSPEILLKMSKTVLCNNKH